MAAADITVRVEPLEADNVVYLPMAPGTSKPGATARGRMHLRFEFTNHELTPVTVERVHLSFSGAPVPAQTREIGVQLGIPGVPLTAPWTVRWAFQHPGDHVLFDLPGPGTVHLSFECEGYSGTTELTFPLAPHHSPVAEGAYLYPARAADLAVAEFWAVNGCNHPTGGEGPQSFAYDMMVWGLDHGTGVWSDHLPAADPLANDGFRIWGKPVYAMADGVVLHALNDCPSNPHPVQVEDDWKKQQDEYWGAYPFGAAGNHLYVQHGDEVVLYAHLQPGSIPPEVLAPGTTVHAGQHLGKAGNSGNSSLPHLHIHAVQGTAPEAGPLRPLVFRDLWAIDNDLVLADPPQGWWSKVEGQGIPEGSVDYWWQNDVFLWPSPVAPPWPEVVHLGVPETAYQGVFDEMTGRGLHLAALDGFVVGDGDAALTCFDVVFRPAAVPGYLARHGLDAQEYQDEYDAWVRDGALSLGAIESYWSAYLGRPAYAPIFVAGPKRPVAAYHGASLTEHDQRYHELAEVHGLAPMSISVVAVGEEREVTARYEAIDVGAFDAAWTLSVPDFQARLDANADNLSLVYVNAYRFAGQLFVVGIWHEKPARPFVQYHLGVDEFDAWTRTTRRDGMLLRAVAGYRGDTEPNHVAVWAPWPA